MALGPGSMLDGYRIVELIGRGGMGAVYLAEDPRLGRKVALKVLAGEMAGMPGSRERFLRESRLAASLDHPHILPIYEAGEADGQHFIAMRYVPGPDLAGLIERDGPLPLERTVGLIGQVASALDAAHAAGLIHRDVKPGNILVASGSQPGSDHAYLSDFGLTKQADSSVVLTRSGQLAGSVGYVAPELIEGHPVDARADIYSLGCVAYECLAGRAPYLRETEMATLFAHVQAPPPSLAADRPELPPAVDEVIVRAMAKSPDDRYATAGDLARALAKAAAPDTGGRHLTRGFLFADLRGYTAFTEAHGDAAAAGLLDAYRQLVRDAVRRSGGAEIRTEGDSFYVVFPSASEAVRCGLDLVAAAATATEHRPERPIRIGVGVHAGETAETAEGYVGSAVNLAARLCAAAAAGEVLVSDTVRGLTRTSGDMVFAPRGRKHFKGIAEPIAVYAATTPAPSGTGAVVAVPRPVTTRLPGLGGHRRAAFAGAGTVGAVVLAVVLVATMVGGGTGKPNMSPGASGGAGSVAGSAAAGQGSPAATASNPPPAASPTAGRIYGAPGPLKPGTYTAMELPGTPTLSITDDRWSIQSSGAPYLVLGLTSSPNDRLTFIWPTALATEPCGSVAQEIGPAPETQFRAWAASTKGLQLGAANARTFGDLSGVNEYDPSIVERYACQVTSPVSLSVTPKPGALYGYGLTLNAGERLRLEMSSRDDRLILILIEAPTEAEFEAFDPLAEAILDTLSFPPSASASP